VKPEIEAFDLSHILKAAEMAGKGSFAGTPYVQFVMGVKNAMPADREVFDFYIKTVIACSAPDAPWCAAGIGANQIVLNEWAIAAGGHARTGLEDNVRLDRQTRWRRRTRRWSGGRWRSATTRAPGGGLAAGAGDAGPEAGGGLTTASMISRA
jgi:hypothetical protein